METPASRWPEMSQLAGLLPGVPGASPGQVIAAQGTQLHVACGSGALALHTLQYPGGRRMDSAAFLQARPVASGTRLG